MRVFGPPIEEATWKLIADQARMIFEQAEPKRTMCARDFAIDEEPERVMAREVDLRSSDGQRMRIAMTEESARPPFEWLMEITSDVGESDYFKHYLVREDGIMLAQRKVLTLIDTEEAEIILRDLQVASSWL